MEKVKLEYIIISFLVALLVYILPLGISGNAHTMLFVMVFVASLWITESAPLHATAIFAAFLIILLIGLKPVDVFAQYFDPVIVLLLGGFVIAVAMNKHKLDEYLAYKILGRAGSSPRLIVLALIGTTTFISMWISNSAAAAIVMPIAVVILVKNRVAIGRSNFGKASVLAVGFGATIGGIGTIVGSTPNVIAAKFLNTAGTSFGFYEWFIRGFPFMLALMIVAWIVLITLFKPEKKTAVTINKKMTMTLEQKKVLAVFVLTIALWITESIHGIHNSVVALVPIILFYFSGMLNTSDFTKIDWATLVLVGGGLALGYGIHATGLDTTFASIISNATGGQSIFALFLLLGVFGVLLTVFISNTTAAAIYLPIVVALATSFGADVTNVVVVAAIGVSLDFIFPFGTPPTAIAYGTRYVNTRDIAKAGIIISILGVLLLAGMALLW
jgi:sodium-dependent dicarboxylate transporter 2/3/5